MEQTITPTKIAPRLLEQLLDFWNRRHFWSKALDKGRGLFKRGVASLNGRIPPLLSRRGGLRE